MENRKTKSLTGQIRSRLVETDKDFPQSIKQHLISVSNKVQNPFTFIVGLFNEGVLFDGSSDSEARFGQDTMVQLAIRIACSKGAGAISGLMSALEGSGNMELLSAIRTWAKEDSSIGDLSEPKGTGDELSYRFQGSLQLAKPKEISHELRSIGTKTNDKEKDSAQTSGTMWKQITSTTEGSSSGTKLIDKMMSRLEDEWIEQLEGHLIGEASKILNFTQFRSSLVQQKVLDESSSVQLKTGLELGGGQWSLKVKAIKAACSKRAIGSLVVALQQSGNERILEETHQWLQTSPATNNNSSPPFVKSLADQPATQALEVVKSNFLAPSTSDLQHSTTLDFKPQVYTRAKFFKYSYYNRAKQTFGLAFGQDRIIAYFGNGKVKVWNSQGNENKTIKIDVLKQEIAWFQYDEELFVLGNAEGTVLLVDAKTLQTKWSVRFSDPVDFRDFDESVIVVLKRGVDQSKIWWAEISRTNMQLLF